MSNLLTHITDKDLRAIADKITDNIRITPEEGLFLYKNADLPFLGLLAGIVRRRHNGNLAYFNRNFHIEPTNKCIYNCRFCSYHKPDGDPESWEYSHEEMLDIVKRFDGKDVTEVHIVGGVHPSYDLHYWGSLLKKIKDYRPALHIKAFSAIELDHMISLAGCSIEEGLLLLKGYGLDSIPGGGAEIFDEELRKKICDEKSSSELWLRIHETAHRIGIPSNATMLYGHIETYSHRINHMERLRILQDETHGFNAFIPLKFRNSHNLFSYLKESPVNEDLKNYALCRIFLDNIQHIKAYWPMIGKQTASISLEFGVDDLDGTIDDSTKIYSLAGAEEKHPFMSTEEMKSIIASAGRIAAERDSLYNIMLEF